MKSSTFGNREIPIKSKDSQASPVSSNWRRLEKWDDEDTEGESSSSSSVSEASTESTEWDEYCEITPPTKVIEKRKFTKKRYEVFHGKNILHTTVFADEYEILAHDSNALCIAFYNYVIKPHPIMIKTNYTVKEQSVIISGVTKIEKIER